MACGSRGLKCSGVHHFYAGKGLTHNMANFRGCGNRMGNSARQTAKQAKAARLQPPKISRRSHLLTIEAVDQYASCDLAGIRSVPSCKVFYSHANQPSSSSLLVGAGNGAPGASCVGSWTYPPLPNGFKEEILERMGVDELVFAGTSRSLLDQPSEFIESRKEAEAILTSSPFLPSFSHVDLGVVADF